MSIVSKEDLLNKQAEAKNTLESFTCRVLVCSGTGCIASGAQKIYDEMAKLCENLDWVSVEMQKDVPHVGVVKTGCQGLCELGPLMKIEPYDYQYVHVQVEDCKEIVERTVMEGEPVSRLFYRDHDTACPHPSDIPFLNQQTRIVLENCGNINAESIDEYIAVEAVWADGSTTYDIVISNNNISTRLLDDDYITFTGVFKGFNDLNDESFSTSSVELLELDQ